MEEYIVTVMEKHKIADDVFIIYPTSVKKGYIDNQDYYFYEKGKRFECPLIVNPEVLLSNHHPTGFYNAVEIANLKGEFGSSITEEEAIKKYKDIYLKLYYILTYDIVYKKVFATAFTKESITNTSIKETNSKEKDELYKEIVYRIEKIKEKKQKEKQNNSLALIENKKDFGIDTKKIFDNITATVINQDEAVKKIITEINRKEILPSARKRSIMLVGPTGVGKTKVMEMVAKYLDRPFLKVDANQLTVPGYVGKDLEEVLFELYNKCKRNMDVTKKAIIFFDEIDKKGSESKGDVSGRGVLNGLLPFVEGATYNATSKTGSSSAYVPINTEDMTVIFAGAFEEVFEAVKATKKRIGYNRDEEDMLNLPTTEDFVKYGLIPKEFIGRTTIIFFKELEIKNLKNILLNSDESAIKEQQKAFSNYNVKLHFSKKCINEICKKAYEDQTGARGLSNIIELITSQPLYDISIDPDKYKAVIITGTNYKEGNHYVLKEKEKVKTKIKKSM